MTRFKIKSKIIISFLLVVLISAIASGYLSYRSSKNNLEQQMLSNLNSIAGAKAGEVTLFFEKFKARTSDWSSDGFIRSEFEAILTDHDNERAQDLGIYIKEKKQIIDPDVIITDIFNFDGTVVVSTDKLRIGHREPSMEELNSEYGFDKAKTASFGEVFISSLVHEDDETGHFDGVPMWHLDVPIVSLKSGKVIGVMVNHILGEKLNELLFTGRDIGPVQQLLPTRETFEVYLVDKDKLMVTPSRFIPDAVLKQKVETEAVVKCIEKREVTLGLYDDYRGVPVFGASACINHNWTLLAEIDQAEVFEGLRKIVIDVLFVSIVIMVIALILAFVLTRGIASSIKKLSELIRVIAAGDFSKRIEVKSNDEIGEFAKVLNDMTDKLDESYKKLEEEKRISANRAEDLEKFKLAVDNASDMIFITDSEGVILYANRSVELVTGFSINEVIGKRPSLWGRQMSAEFYENMWDAIKNKKMTFACEITNKKKNGEKYVAELFIAPLVDEFRTIKFFVGIERDITKLKEVDKAKNEFISLASHQLLTPLTTVAWFVETLSMSLVGKLKKEEKKYLDDVYRINHSMIDLVRALLDVSRIELGVFSIEPELVNLVSIVDDVLKESSQKSEVKKINVVKEYERTPIINMDPNLIKIVLQNLISNAIKYTPEKGTVRISIIEQDANILIKVADTGYGIPKDEQVKVFSKFYRSPSIKKKGEGTGLGLYITKSIIDHSGGKIWFESEENKGTTFYVEFTAEGMKKKEGEKKLGM